jgi:hypothetical protein
VIKVFGIIILSTISSAEEKIETVKNKIIKDLSIVYMLTVIDKIE